MDTVSRDSDTIALEIQNLGDRGRDLGFVLDNEYLRRAQGRRHRFIRP